MSGRDVFLSYSRSDRETARRFAKSLTEEGFNVWWDAALRAGETFDEVIENALRAAKGVVVLWSPRSVASRWVRAEATLADRANKLIPVLIENCNRPIIFELMHTTDLSEWDGSSADAAWQGMVADLRRLVDEDEEPELAVAAPSASAAASQKRSARVDSGSASAESQAVPLKRDNRMFAPIRLEDAGRGSDGRGEDSSDEDSTRIYRSSNSQSELVHCLELTVGDLVEKRLIVGADGLRIGRSAPSDVILADARVSRAHCTVQLSNQGLRVFDLNSTNGTYVDGNRLTGTGILPVGSVLKVGNVSFRHELRSSGDL